MLEVIKNNQERIALEPIAQRHVKPMASLAGNPKILDRMLFKPQPFTVNDAQEFVERAQNSNPLELLSYAIVDRLTREFLGVTSISVKPNHVIPSFGYWLGEQHWNKGLASETVGVVVRDVLPEFRFAILRAGCEIDNHASQRVLEKNGFKPQETGSLNIGDQKSIDIKWYQINLAPYQGYKSTDAKEDIAT
jgi:ribosomal-protein-alanine N-acetyltransferase